MTSLQHRANRLELHHAIHIEAGKSAQHLDRYQLSRRPGLSPQPPIYALERWLAGFNQPEHAVASGPSPSALRYAVVASSVEEPVPAQASSHRVPPPPKLPGALQSAEADDDGWTPTSLNFHVGANQLVVRCHVCPYSGAVRDLRIDLLPLSS